MIVVLKPNLPLAEVEKVIAEVAKLGYEPRPIHGKVQTVIAAIGDENTHQSLEMLSSWPQVEHVHRVQKRYKLVSREVKKGADKDTIVKVHGQEIGAGKKFCFMAGPCSVESEEQLMATAKAVKAQGATFSRGKGCNDCNKTTYRGRFGIFEIFVIDDEARKLIYERVPSSVLRARAREMGMRTLREDGIRKVLAGMTTPDEVITATMGDKE